MWGTVLTGNESPAAVTPYTNLYFRVKATSSVVASAIQNLVVPSRPSAPEFTINYPAELSEQVVPSTVEYSSSSNMSDATSGAGYTISIVPGQNIYFRTKASATAFKSDVKTLYPPVRPATPYISINYFDETTNHVISSAYEYFDNRDLTNLENLPEQSWISIYNLNGKLLKAEYYKEKKVEISVAGLTPGLYFIKIKTQKGESQSKFSKL